MVCWVCVARRFDWYQKAVGVAQPSHSFFAVGRGWSDMCLAQHLPGHSCSAGESSLSLLPAAVTL